LPLWLENLLLKAVARDPADRIETAEEFLVSLERGPGNPSVPRGTMPLAKRDPVSLWRAVAAISVVLNLLLLYLLVVR
jgi:hypothetical protein